jgi:integrase
MGRPKLDTPNFVLRPNRLGVWECRWTDPATGRTRFKSTGTRDESEAHARLGAIVASIDVPRPPAVLRVGPILDAYLKSKPSEIFTVKPLRERLGFMEPGALNDAVAKSYAAWRASSGISDGTIIRELVILRAGLRWGTRNGLGYKEDDIGIFTMPVNRPPPKDRWLTMQECYRLIYTGCPSEEQAHLRLFVRIALAVGARTEAILELTWDRVELPIAPATKWVGDQNSGHEKLVQPVMLDFGKGVGRKRRVRHVPIGDNAALYHELVAAKQRAKTNYVIEWRGRPVSDIRTALNKAYKRAGIADASGAHLLRHTCATLMVIAGIPYEKIGKLVGASAKMIETTYGHHSADYLQTVGRVTAF